MKLPRLLDSALPYWIAGVGCYTPILMRWFETPGSYSGSFWGAIGWAAESLVVAGIGFPLIAVVFFLWHPQSKPQMTIGIAASLLLFVGPAFEPHYGGPDVYATTFDFRAELCIISCCMLGSQLLPIGVVAFTSLRLMRDRDEASQGEISGTRGLSIWQLLFFTLCCAIGMSLTVSVYREHMAQLYPDPELFRRLGLAPIVMCFGTSAATLMSLRIHRFRPTVKVAWGFLCLIVLGLSALVSSFFGGYHLIPDISQGYDLERVTFRAVALFLVSCLSVCVFLGFLYATRFRLDVFPLPPDSSRRGDT